MLGWARGILWYVRLGTRLASYLASSPGPLRGVRRAWYTLFAHALFSQQTLGIRILVYLFLRRCNLWPPLLSHELVKFCANQWYPANILEPGPFSSSQRAWGRGSYLAVEDRVVYTRQLINHLETRAKRGDPCTVLQFHLVADRRTRL